MSNSLRPQFGYHLHQTVEEEKKALHIAFELVHNARLAGAEMRLWATRATQYTKTLLRELKNQDSLSNEKKLLQCSTWENEILMCLSSYMNDATDFMNRLRPLNPPLRTDQLKPFLQAMESDRQVTINALESLSKTASELTAYKTSVQQSSAA